MRHDMVRWSEDDLNAARARLSCQDKGTRAGRKSKLHNQRVEWQGGWFDSKHELKRYQEFELQRSMGAIRAVIRQVSIPLPGTRRRIRVDFLVVENEGRLRWFDAKGPFETQMSKLKRAQMRDAYGLEIELC